MPGQVFIRFHTQWFYIPAIITIAFIFAFVSVKDCYKKIKNFVKMLDDDQKKVYSEIRKERENTYWCALMQGSFMAIIYIIVSTLMGGRSKSIYHMISDILCIVFATTYFVYTLKEKKKVMLIDGDMDEKQEKQWITIYRCMQRQFWSSFLIGLLFSGFVFSLLDILSPPVMICVNPKTRSKKVVFKK
jgi:nitrate/nitrite transporter NarK